ncbi:site-specific integrase [Nocardia sp. CA-119907]|uniref:site-specific integrase n=1 Tax=Nocardia sp. CA-119907 TaxID=3239973 RepID=UPI003D986AED
MPREALEPGGYPPKDKLQPVKGADGVWRLSEVRHRAINGEYVRSSGSGPTRDLCMAAFWENFEKNRFKGSVRRKRRTRKTVLFKPTDKMSAVLKHHADVLRQRFEKGEIKERSYYLYRTAIYPSDSPRAKEDAIKLENELGAFTIAEVGRPSELASYVADIAEIAPGMALRHHTILTAVFRMLTLQGLYDDSPMRLVPRPDLNGGGQRALDVDSRAEFVKLLCDKGRTPRNHDYVLPFGLTVLGTGVRPGEGLALRWMDIPDLDDDTVERAVAHICGTIVKPVGRKPYRQDGRKAGDSYYVTLPRWLTSELRAWKLVCAPTDETALMFTLSGEPIAPDVAGYALECLRVGTGLDWMTWGNLRDTVATEVKGKTGDSKRASAQLGHSEGSSMATRHYIDRQGYKRAAVDNAEALESLYPENDGNLTVSVRFGQ